MKNRMKNVMMVVVIALISQSCATLFGGGKYVATIKPHNPNSTIYVNGVDYGKGDIEIKHKRNKTMYVESVAVDGSKASVKVTKKFRWGIQGATLGTALFFWPVLPVGLGIDLISGGAFKPNTDIKGVNKIDNKNYEISID